MSVLDGLATCFEEFLNVICQRRERVPRLRGMPHRSPLNRQSGGCSRLPDGHALFDTVDSVFYLCVAHWRKAVILLAKYIKHGIEHNPADLAFSDHHDKDSHGG